MVTSDIRDVEESRAGSALQCNADTCDDDSLCRGASRHARSVHYYFTTSATLRLAFVLLAAEAGEDTATAAS